MPRYLNDLDVFYDPSQQHAFNPGFDEGPAPVIPQKLLVNSTATSGSHDTTAIDAYLQGVELTQLKRHDAGFAKIWSGEAGHQMLVTWHGETGPSITDPFTDDETAYFTDPTAIIRNNPLFPVLLFPIQAAPENTPPARTLRYKTTHSPRPKGGLAVYRTSQDNSGVTFNGAIEPLVVRLQPSFYSNDVPINPHIVGGFVGCGNVDVVGSTDQVVTVDYYDTSKHQPPFTDNEYAINQTHFQSVSGSMTPLTSSVATLSDRAVVHKASRALLGAFIDKRYVRNVLPDPFEDASMTNVLSLMTGSTDNYVRFDQRSATCGWSFDNNTAVGTDSLAFGGMTH
jgi:hypothetical protein